MQRLATPESPQKGKKKKRAQEKEYKTTAAMEPAVEKSWVNVNSEKRQGHIPFFTIVTRITKSTKTICVHSL